MSLAREVSNSAAQVAGVAALVHSADMSDVDDIRSASDTTAVRAEAGEVHGERDGTTDHHPTDSVRGESGTGMHDAAPARRPSPQAPGNRTPSSGLAPIDERVPNIRQAGDTERPRTRVQR